MTLFLRLLDSTDKATDLHRSVQGGEKQFATDPISFKEVPGSPFAYWTTDTVRALFREKISFEGLGRNVLGGLKTLSDERFVRSWWEIQIHNRKGWPNLAKGGMYSPFYADVFLCVNWKSQGEEISWYGYQRRPREGFGASSRGIEAYFRPGLTWPRRTQSGLGMRAMPAGCIFADKGPAAFVEGDDPADLLALLGLTTSAPFRYLVELQMAFGSYEVGVIQRTPIPNVTNEVRKSLVHHARRAWHLKRMLDTVNETSHAFLLPATLRIHLGAYTRTGTEVELIRIQRAIDDLAFGAYGIDGVDRGTIEAWASSKLMDIISKDDETAGDAEAEEDEGYTTADTTVTLYSWAVGVAFGRFDLRLATSERQVPAEPEPFDPLPARSPGMIPESDEDQFPARPLLVDDPGHSLDLAAEAGTVLQRVGFAPENQETLRRWLARDFFPLHIKMYSKSRRKAPIYWQLATPSASYSVWLYIHAFSRDTLYQVQEIAGTKLLHEERKLESLRADFGPNPTAATRKELTAQETLIEELRAFLEEVNRVAPLWNPNLDDGVILNFALLWRLVPHHKPWQKELKAKWDELCDGKYDWAHLAMHLWPERVVPKCATDRSLAIAHGIEEVFWMEGEDGKWRPRPIPARSVEELVNEHTSPAVRAALKDLLEAPTALSSARRGRPQGTRGAAGETA